MSRVTRNYLRKISDRARQQAAPHGSRAVSGTSPYAILVAWSVPEAALRDTMKGARGGRCERRPATVRPTGKLWRGCNPWVTAEATVRWSMTAE